MSIHASLRSAKGAAGRLRNVLKRYERIRFLVTKGAWEDGRSVFGLPKMKQVRVKAKKAEVKEKEEATPTTETPETPGATPPKAESK